MADLSPIQIKHAFGLAPEKAVNYLASLGVEISWDWKEQLEIVRRRAFTVAKTSSAELLQTMLDELNRGLKEGVPWTEWKKDAGGLLERKGWKTREDGSAWRLDTIYRTNLQSAYQAGRYEQMMAADRFEFWEYRAVGDKRTRPRHQELDGLILPKNHPFWKRVFPPNGYRCRCSVTALTRKQALARGYQEPKGSKAVTPSGRIIDLDKWHPDAGFEGVPGQSWEPDLKKFDPKISKQLKKDLDSRPEPKKTEPEQAEPEPEKRPQVDWGNRPPRTDDEPQTYAVTQEELEALQKEFPSGFVHDAAMELAFARRRTGGKAPSNVRKDVEWTPLDRSAVGIYTGDGYYHLNPPLYKNQKIAKRIEPIYRAIDNALKKLDDAPDGVRWKGVAFTDKEYEKFLVEYQVGQTVTWHAYGSTITDKRTARAFGSPHASKKHRVLMTVESGGKSVVELSPHDEKEILYERGSQFRVDEVWKDEKAETTYVKLIKL